MNQKYYILTGKLDGRHEVIFGDYFKSTVQDEKDDVAYGNGALPKEDRYTGLKVHSLTSDYQDATNELIERLNS